MKFHHVPLFLAVSAAITSSAAAACTVKLGDQLLSADLERGRKAFLKCKACHTVKDGESNLVGPNLSRIMTRGESGAAGFNYSPAFLKAKLGWTLPTLDTFLEKPSKIVPGNKMVFAGIAKPQERADLIAWLAKESGTSLPGCK